MFHEIVVPVINMHTEHTQHVRKIHLLMYWLLMQNTFFTLGHNKKIIGKQLP